MAEGHIALSAAELVYLFRQLGGTALPGVSDPYRPLNETERTQLTIAAEDSLRERGLCKRAFGGKAVYDAELLRLLRFCTEFTRYIGFDYRNAREQLTTKRFYGLNGEWMEISGGAEAFGLRECSAQSILESLNVLPKAEAAEVSLLIPKKDFKVISRMVQRGQLGDARRMLSELEVPAEGREFLLDGMMFQTEYYSITLAVREENGLRAQNAAALCKGRTMAEFYQTVADDDRTMIGLRSAMKGTYRILRETAENWLNT